MERIIHDHGSIGEARSMSGKDHADTARVPRIAMLMNPRSHRNQGRSIERVKGVNIEVLQPPTKDALAESLRELRDKGTELLIINGGDGTVRDVLTKGQPVFGDSWPVLAVLPRGKTNALNVDLGAPSDWSLTDAVEAYRSGRRVTRRALTVSEQGKDGPPLMGFILGAGAYTLGIEAGQEAHRVGFFDSLAVGATVAWGVVQALMGRDSNRWRRGIEMRMAHHPSGEPMPHSRHGTPERRHIMLASTLKHLPMGIQLFGKDPAPIRIIALDHPRRRVFAIIPAVLAGWHPRWLAQVGLHHISAEAFSMELNAPFILDGEHFPAGRYLVEQGPALNFVTA